MAEQQLDGAQIGAGFQQVNGEGVAQRMRRDRLADAGPLTGLPAGAFDGERRDRLAGPVARKQPLFRASGSSSSPAACPTAWARASHSGLSALCPASTRMTMRWLSIAAGLQADRFGDAQTRRVADGQDHAVLQVFTASRNAATSSGLSTTGSFCGCRPVGMSSSTVQGRLSVTV